MISTSINLDGIDFPEINAPIGSFAYTTLSSNLLFISGQICSGVNGLEIKGRLGAEVSLADGQRAARLSAINVLGHLKAAVGGELERIEQIVRITGYVASTHDFTDHHLVVNGASDLLVSVLAERGRHTRAAVGVNALPLNAAVEVDAIVRVRV